LQAFVAGIDVAEMNLAFACQQSAAKQTLLALEDGCAKPALSEGKRKAATLQSAAQHGNPGRVSIPAHRYGIRNEIPPE
jgi:hypothetical protein